MGLQNYFKDSYRILNEIKYALKMLYPVEVGATLNDE